MWKHYVAGVVPGLVLNGIWTIFTGRYGFGVISTTIFLLPFGLLAGFLGHMADKSKSKQPPKAFRDVAISFVLGILFVIVGLLILVDSFYW